MKILNRWVAKHLWFAYIFAIALMLILLLVLQNRLPFLVAYLLFLVWPWFISFVLITWVNQLLKEPMAQLNQHCDPVPFLEETSLQLQYPGPKPMQNIRKVNYAVALHYLGRSDEALEVLSATQLVKGQKASHYVVYYRNLMLVLLAASRHQEAEAAFDNMMQFYGKIKNGKIRRQLEPAVACAQAEMHLLHGEYDRALEKFRAEPQTLLGQVCDAWFQAKVYLARGERKEAKEKLEFVVENGNRLYIKVQAQVFLDKINLEEQSL